MPKFSFFFVFPILSSFLPFCSFNFIFFLLQITVLHVRFCYLSTRTLPVNDGTENGRRCAAVGQESRGEDAIAQDQADKEAHEEAQSDGQEGWEQF